MIITGGICTDRPCGIAHAGRPRLQPATWFGGGNDYVSGGVWMPDVSNFLYDCDFFVGQFSGRVVRGILSHFWQGTPYFGVSVGLLESSKVTIHIGKGVATGYYTLNSTQLLTARRWYHLRYQYIAPLSQLYIDDALWITSSAYPLIFGAQNYNFAVGRWASNYNDYYCNGCIRKVQINDGAVVDWPGDGILPENWGGAEVYGSPDRCLIRGDGAVILNNQILTP